MRYYVMCYTRRPDQSLYYEERLAYSMHLALKEGEGAFQPLNHNSGVLFARATENEDGSLNPKSLRDPVLYRRPDGGFGVRAVRIEGDGDEEPQPTVLCWSSDDLIIYKENPGAADMGQFDGASPQVSYEMEQATGMSLQGSSEAEQFGETNLQVSSDKKHPPCRRRSLSPARMM